MSFISRTFRRLVLASTLLGTVPALAQTAPAATSDVLREITDVVGLKPRFELRATKEIPNAAAVVVQDKRYLFYNPSFVASVNRAGHTDWAGISILAHEMGHHLNGHTLRPGGSQPADELEADEFSGFVLRKMGASLAQSQAALAAVADDEGSATHPGRQVRLKSISAGWQRAEAQIVASTHQPSPSAAPVVVAARPAPVQADEDETAALTASARRPDAPVRLLGQLTFSARPDQRFYLTSNLNLVRLPEEGSDLSEAEVVGRLRRTTNSTFPFVLEDSQQRHLFVTPRGDVYDKAGKRVAKLQDPS